MWSRRWKEDVDKRKYNVIIGLDEVSAISNPIATQLQLDPCIISANRTHTTLLSKLYNDNKGAGWWWVMVL